MGIFEELKYLGTRLRRLMRGLPLWSAPMQNILQKQTSYGLRLLFYLTGERDNLGYLIDVLILRPPFFDEPSVDQCVPFVNKCCYLCFKRWINIV